MLGTRVRPGVRPRTGTRPQRGLSRVRAARDVRRRRGAREWLFALADGVGGQDLGEVASRTAVESLLAGFRRARDGEQHCGAAAAAGAGSQHAKCSRPEWPAGRGGSAMATTLVACALRFDRVVVAHVGDSRCYRIRHGHAEALTRDHTVTNEQVLLGFSPPARRRKRGPATCSAARWETRCSSTSIPHEHQLLPGDVLLLCSDGLHNLVTPPEMADIATRHARLEDAARELVDLANQRGRQR